MQLSSTSKMSASIAMGDSFGVKRVALRGPNNFDQRFIANSSGNRFTGRYPKRQDQAR
jgi:hypothetical protein